MTIATATVSTLIKRGLTAAVLVTIGAAAISQAEAATARREPNDRGYAGCLRRSGRWFSGWSDCSYYTYGQCRAAIIGPPGGDCEPNPWSYYVNEPPAPAPRARKRARR
jgi:hypothetical protein